MFRFLSKLFSNKKAHYDYPNEFALIRFTDNAKKHAVFEDMTKEIEYHNGNMVRLFAYSDEKLEILQDDGVPFYDETGEDFKLTISKKINPQVVSYEQNAEKEGG